MTDEMMDRLWTVTAIAMVCALAAAFSWASPFGLLGALAGIYLVRAGQIFAPDDATRNAFFKVGRPLFVSALIPFCIRFFGI